MTLIHLFLLLAQNFMRILYTWLASHSINLWRIPLINVYCSGDRPHLNTMVMVFFPLCRVDQLSLSTISIFHDLFVSHLYSLPLYVSIEALSKLATHCLENAKVSRLLRLQSVTSTMILLLLDFYNSFLKFSLRSKILVGNIRIFLIVN